MDSNERDKNRNPGRGVGSGSALPASKRAPRAAGVSSVEPQGPGNRSARPEIDTLLDRVSRSEERLVKAERRIQWLESRNVIDDVTGLLNRRGLDDALDRALARARRYGETGTLLMLDLPGYETIVEERGAAAGDYVLAAVGSILLRQFREVDYIARLQGGRFAALLLQMAAADADRRAAMLRDHLATVTVPWDGDDIAIGVRTGFALYARNEAAGDVFERAEAELEARERRIARLRKPAS